MTAKQNKNFILEAVLACLGGICLYLLTNSIITRAVNCDIGWLTYAAEASLNGKVLYRDLFEINPPLVFFLHFLSNFIADFINYDYQVTFNSMVLALTMLCYALTLKLIWKTLDTSVKRLVLIPGLFVYFVILPLNGGFFGEREHLFVIFVTPYILSVYLKVTGAENRDYSWVVYTLCLFGFLLKPFYLFFFVAIEISILMGNRASFKERQPTYLILLSLIFVYVAASYVYFPYYFSEVLPIGMKTYYGHRFDLDEMLYTGLPNFVPLAFVLLLIAFTDGLLNIRSRRLWVGLLAAATVLPLAQFKGWEYTYFPLLSFSFLIALMVVFEADLVGMAIKIFKKNPAIKWKNLPFALGTTCALFAAATIGIVAKLFFELSTVSMFLQPLPLYFLVFLFVFITRKKPFNIPTNIFLASVGLVFLILYPLQETLFMLMFIDSTALWIITGVIIIGGAYSGLKLNVTTENKKYFLPIILLAICAFYIRFINLNLDDLKHTSRSDVVYAKLEDVIKANSPHNSLFIFNTNLYPAFPLVNYTHSNWGTRFHHLWMLPAIYEDSTVEDHCFVDSKFYADRDYTYSAIFHDLSISKPDLIIFDQSPQKFIWRRANYYNWNECINQAHKPLADFIKNNYALLKKVNYCVGSRRWSCAYDIYKAKRIGGGKVAKPHRSKSGV